MLRALGITLVGSLVAAAAIGAPSAAATAEPTEATPMPAAQIVVASQDPILRTDAAGYTFTVLLRNLGAEPLEAGSLELRLRTDRIDDTAELQAASVSIAEETPGTLLVSAEAPATSAGESRTLTLTVPRTAMPLSRTSEPGTYLVSVEYLPETEPTTPAPDVTGGITPDGTAETTPDATAGTGDAAGEASADATTTELRSSGVFVWERADTKRSLPLTLVVPFVLPEAVDGMPSTDDLAAAVPRFNALLDAAERWRATIAVDPRIVAGIRGYGNAAPAAARDFLTRLTTTLRPIFMLQFGDADPAAQAALGAERLLGPSGLSFVTSQGSFPVADDPGAAGGSTSGSTGTGESGAGTGTGSSDVGTNEEPGTDPLPEPDVATPPTLDELLDWPSADLAAWPAEGQVNARTLALLKKSGMTSLVIDSANLSRARAARVGVGGLEALVSDAGLAASAATALSAESETERSAGAAELVARLALGAESSALGMALALDRGAVADASTPGALIDTLDLVDWVTATSAESQTRGSGRFVPGHPARERLTQLREATDRSERIDALAPLLERPWYLPEYQRARLLTAYATRYADGTDLEAEQRRLARDSELLRGVEVLPSENTQLIGTSSRVPVPVHNSLPFDALVTLRVAPTSATISVPERRFESEMVPAGANATVLVPVDSRVSSGDAVLAIRVADSIDDTVFSSTNMQLTIRSSFEAIMLGGLGVLAALLFGFGVWRSVRRHRADGNLRPATGDAE